MRISGLSEIAGRFDGFLIDQFGVIHDGQRLYAGTLRVLSELQGLGKPVVVMTNSGKRAEANRRRLVKMGIPRAHFADAMSSGEVAYALLSSSPLWGEGRVRGAGSVADIQPPVTLQDPSPYPLPDGERNDQGIPKENDESQSARPRSSSPQRGEGRVRGGAASTPRAYLIGKEGEDYGFDGVRFAGDPRDADLILILGSNAPATSLDQYRELLRELTIPALCCNPDKLMLTPQGLQPAPGAIAALYEEQGGTVTWIGKPYPEIYEQAAALVGNPRRILCVGDSPEHDVAGGRGAGFSTLLVEQGVSAGHALRPEDPQPDFVMKDFTW